MVTVSKHFIHIITSGFAIMILAAVLLYGFTLLQKDLAAQNADKAYVGKLQQNVGVMNQVEIDETAVLQKWRRGEFTTGESIEALSAAKAKRQNIDENFFSRAPPEKFLQIHSRIRKANSDFISADDLYSTGILEKRVELIAEGDAKAKIAKETLDSAIADLNNLGFRI